MRHAFGCEIGLEGQGNAGVVVPFVDQAGGEERPWFVVSKNKDGEIICC